MKPILKILSIFLVRYLQRKYKHITITCEYKRTNQNINKLILIQSILYYFKRQFHAHGYFHPSCSWDPSDEKFYRKLFPQKEQFNEWEIVIWHNPEAVTYYQNKIYHLNDQKSTLYAYEIKKQLIKNKDWN